MLECREQIVALKEKKMPTRQMDGKGTQHMSAQPHLHQSAPEIQARTEQ
jgi:hypothetical protein